MDGCSYFMVRRDSRKELKRLACSIGVCLVGCQTIETREIVSIIEFNFSSEKWHSAASVDRSFVIYAHPESSPASFWCYRTGRSRACLSVVIPTSDAWRGGYFVKLLSQIKQQDLSDYELIVIKGDPRQGRAINIGAALSEGKYIITLDDDTALPDPGTFRKLKAVMETHPDIGIAGGNNIIPSDASRFIKNVMKQIPRRSWEPVSEITDSDLAEHPCMIIRTTEFKRLGGENELIPRGLDPYLRREFRLAGLRVVVIPGVFYHHLPPSTMKRLLRQFFRNGKDAAFTIYNYSQWVIETPANHGPFRESVSPLYRYSRFPVRLIAALLKGEIYFFVCQIVYAFGYFISILKLKLNR